MSNRNLWEDRETLHRLYVEEGMSSAEIAEDEGVSPQTILNWLKENDIETRGSSQSDGDIKRHYTDAEWLRTEYVTKQRPCAEIAEDLGCTRWTVWNWLKKHGIETRTGRNHPADERLEDESWLREEYVKNQRSTYKIADQLDCDEASIRRWLDKHDIETRAVRRPPVDDRVEDEAWLREKYVDEEKSIAKIAEGMDCSFRSVSYWLDKHGIETRPPSERVGSYPGGFDYGEGWNEAKRERVRDSQDRKCATCGMDESEHMSEFYERLHVHHKQSARSFDDAERRNAEGNLVALCRPCHTEWEKWTPLFPQTDIAPSSKTQQMEREA